MSKALDSIIVAAPLLVCSFMPVFAQESVCLTAPDDASAAEIVVIQNQCQILKRLESLEPRVAIIERQTNTQQPVSAISTLAAPTSSPYVVFDPGMAGTTTGGNPCSGGEMITMSCNNYVQNWMQQTCWDGKCTPLFAPRIDDSMPLWKDYLMDGSAQPIDLSKLTAEILATPGALSVNGDAIILNLDGFLEMTDPTDMFE